MNVEDMCYTCLKTGNQSLVNINNSDLDKTSYLQKLLFCVSVDLVLTENMEICINCLENLKTAYRFKEIVIQSQNTLRKYSEQLNISPMKEEEENLEWFEDKIIAKIQEKAADYENDIFNDLTTEMKNEVIDETQQDTKNKYEECSEEKNIKLGDSDKIHKADKRNKSNNINCKYCGMKLENNFEMQKHIISAHTKKHYTCKFCNKQFKQVHQLDDHLLSHKSDKIFRCNFCDKTFTHASSRARHLKSHTAPPGEKSRRTPFLCTICGKSFPFSNGAQRHMRIHFGMRNHECKICQKKFSQSTHLHVHLRTHSGEKPYICEECGETFSLRASLRKHISTIHKRDHNVKKKMLL